MNKKIKNRAELVREIIKTTNEELNDEELIHSLVSQKVSYDSKIDNRATFGQRSADAVARFAGSWAFIFSFLAGMGVWMLINVFMAANAFDVYPFILLNLVLSCVAAIQAPLIMMSQNRRESKDRARSENDYKVNLKNEIVIDDLHIKIDELLENQNKIITQMRKIEENLNINPDSSPKTSVKK